MIELVLQHWIK